jgi:hypothetical protein
MTVYMAAPLDLSALPLNGPRVPQAQWGMEQPDVSPNSCVAPEVGLVPIGGAAPAAAQPAAAGAAQAQPVVSTADAGPDLDGLWKSLATTVSQLQPGLNEFHGFDQLPNEVTAKLPASVFAAWRGNVIRLDGAKEPLAPETLGELNVVADGKPTTDAAERLVWFFRKIARYGSPLIVGLTRRCDTSRFCAPSSPARR